MNVLGLSPLDYFRCWVRPQELPDLTQLAQDLEAFDLLPADVRLAVNEFPIRLESESIREAVKIFGPQVVNFSLDFASRLLISKEAPEASPIYGKDELL